MTNMKPPDSLAVLGEGKRSGVGGWKGREWKGKEKGGEGREKEWKRREKEKDCIPLTKILDLPLYGLDSYITVI